MATVIATVDATCHQANTGSVIYKTSITPPLTPADELSALELDSSSSGESSSTSTTLSTTVSSESTNPSVAAATQEIVTSTSSSAPAVHHHLLSFGDGKQPLTHYLSDSNSTPDYVETVNAQGDVIGVSIKYCDQYTFEVHNHRFGAWEVSEERSLWTGNVELEGKYPAWLRPRIAPEGNGGWFKAKGVQGWSVYSLYSSRKGCFIPYGLRMTWETGLPSMYRLRVGDFWVVHVMKFMDGHMSGYHYLPDHLLQSFEDTQAFREFSIPKGSRLGAYTLLLAYWRQLGLFQRSYSPASSVRRELFGGWLAPILLPFRLPLALYDLLLLRHQDRRNLPPWRRILRYAIFHANATIVDPECGTPFADRRDGAKWTLALRAFLFILVPTLAATAFACIGAGGDVWIATISTSAFCMWAVFRVLFDGVRRDVFVHRSLDDFKYFAYHIDQVHDKFIKRQVYKVTSEEILEKLGRPEILPCDCISRPGAEFNANTKADLLWR